MKARSQNQSRLRPSDEVAHAKRSQKKPAPPLRKGRSISETLKPRDSRVTINSEFASAEDFVSQYVSNISTSGVFVRYGEQVPIGTFVNLNFTILCDEIETITGVGEVVRVQENPAGIGIEFRSLSEESMELIERLVGEGLGEA